MRKLSMKPSAGNDPNWNKKYHRKETTLNYIKLHSNFTKQPLKATTQSKHSKQPLKANTQSKHSKQTLYDDSEWYDDSDDRCDDRCEWYDDIIWYMMLWWRWRWRWRW